MANEREPICEYYAGACLFMRDFPDQEPPSLASNMTMYLTPDIFKVFDAKLNYRGDIYYCRAADIVTKFPGASQKADCDKYTPNQGSIVSLK